jgi:hypothetical protein
VIIIIQKTFLPFIIIINYKVLALFQAHYGNTLKYITLFNTYILHVYRPLEQIALIINSE